MSAFTKADQTRTDEEWAELGIDDYEILAAEAYQAEILGEGYDFSEDDFRDAYRGEYDSAKDYAEEYIDECTSVDLDQDLFNDWGPLRFYIDFESIADDLDKAGMYFIESPNGGVFVFDA